MDKRISNMLQVAYVKRYTLSDGKENGLRVVEIDNGTLRFTLNESKALDIMQVWYKGENISFVSKNGFSLKDKDFSKRFEGGMLYTVGLDNAGVREGFELHGSFHNLPAKIISATCDGKRIEVIAEVEDTELFGKNLVMIRKYSTDIYSNTFTLTDVLENRGTKAENYCLLYHYNLGYPFIGENTEILFDEKNIIPRTKVSDENNIMVHKFSAPIDNIEEKCYFIVNNKPYVTIKGSSGKIIKFSYSDDSLFGMLLWKSYASGDYALGIEPTTTFLDDKFEYKALGQGQSVKFETQLSILD